jgi:hypothetical protein
LFDQIRDLDLDSPHRIVGGESIGIANVQSEPLAGFDGICANED